MSPYLLFKFFHVLLAILAVGLSASYMVWMSRGAADPERLPFTLRSIRYIDSRFTNPAFGGLLLTGTIMVLVIGYRLTTFWIDAAVVLFVVVALLGSLVYAPSFRRLRLASEAGTADPALLRPLVRRALLMNVVVGLIVFAIIALMVFKPNF